jgi:multimeric flavodoxin WrbA
VQTRCFGWPVTALRWRAGAAFVTGAHVSAGKDATMGAIHTFMLSVQMVVVGSDAQRAGCLVGACATDHNESAPTPELTPGETEDAKGLGYRLAKAAQELRPLMV